MWSQNNSKPVAFAAGSRKNADPPHSPIKFSYGSKHFFGLFEKPRGRWQGVGGDGEVSERCEIIRWKKDGRYL
jgi:hypothetical protein